MKLTEAQGRYYRDIWLAGDKGKRYNGRGRKVLKRLEELGLIELETEWWMDSLKGHLHERFTARIPRQPRILDL